MRVDEGGGSRTLTIKISFETCRLNGTLPCVLHTPVDVEQPGHAQSCNVETHAWLYNLNVSTIVHEFYLLCMWLFRCLLVQSLLSCARCSLAGRGLPNEGKTWCRNMTSQLQSLPTHIVSECCFTYAVGVLHLTQAQRCNKETTWLYPGECSNLLMMSNIIYFRGLPH